MNCELSILEMKNKLKIGYVQIVLLNPLKIMAKMLKNDKVLALESV